MRSEDGVYEVRVRVQLVVQHRVECFESRQSKSKKKSPKVNIDNGGEQENDLQIINQPRVTFITQQEIRC